MKSRTLKKENKGFALLFSVLISSLLLTIGLSIFSIALKELAISTASRQSIHAFYAADSGREYALYHDTKKGDIFTSVDINNVISTGASLSIFKPSPSTFTSVSMDGGPNYRVEIIKQKNPSVPICGSQAICTTIISNGFDSAGGDRVERAIRQDY